MNVWPLRAANGINNATMFEQFANLFCIHSCSARICQPLVSLTAAWDGLCCPITFLEEFKILSRQLLDRAQLLEGLL